MKFVLKLLGIIGVSLIILKATQLFIDYLYEKYGRRYIVSEEN